MKKIFFLLLFLMGLLGACENKQIVGQKSETGIVVNKHKDAVNVSKEEKTFTGEKEKNVLNVNKEQIKENINLLVTPNDTIFLKKKVYSGEKMSKYSWSFSMKKPSLNEMTNWHSIVSGYHVIWSKKILITKDILNNYVGQIPKEEAEYFYGKNFKGNLKRSFCIDASYGTGHKNVTLSPKQIQDIKNGKKVYVVITGDYWGKGYGILTCNHNGCRNKGYKPLHFTEKEIEFFKKHGWIVLDPGWNTVDYSKDEANKPYVCDFKFSEEWNNFIKIIGGDTEDYKRYPYNSLYISSDFLLHVFHKVFDNELKYKEETEFRGKVLNIAQTEFEKYKNKYLNAKDKTLKRVYEFLVSYEAIESSLLLPKKTLLGSDTYNIKEPTDEEIKQKVIDTLKSKISFLPSETQKVIVNEMKLILEAKEKKVDPLILYFFPNDKEFIKLNVKQDFTQFRPRSHYTTDSLLKTYFMGMKWLMREKFYFKSENLAKASLILAKNLDDEELSELKQIQNFVDKLIGSDDDVNIFDLRKFVKNNDLFTDQDVMNKFNIDIQNKLLNLKEQKIISTSYTTKTFGEKTEKQAHNDTVGFVFFGEKFTIDSWMFDQLTAGSAEKEGNKKPNITTALVVPYVLNNNSIAGKLTKMWLEEKGVNDNKINMYMNIAKALIDKVQYFDFSKNIYNQWLDTLNYIFVKITGNKPYWLKDSLYNLRKLLTYMGSYTELKHDTLLYVKQAYAGLGGGGDDCCLVINPPALPIPKGYVEPNVDLIDQLIKLSQETNKIMKSDKFTALEQKLKFLRKIALAEIKNKKISDEDFEKLRLIDFIDILKPDKAYGNILEKESRGAIIGDIFNSGFLGSLYEALGRPALMLMMVKDINGARVVLGPVYTHYEFYKDGKRLTDEDWQAGYDKKFRNDDKLKGLEYRLLGKAISK